TNEKREQCGDEHEGSAEANDFRKSGVHDSTDLATRSLGSRGRKAWRKKSISSLNTSSSVFVATVKKKSRCVHHSPCMTKVDARSRAATRGSMLRNSPVSMPRFTSASTRR